MTSTTPSGSRTTDARAGRYCHGTGTRRGATHDRRCRRTYRISSISTPSSVRWLSVADLPRSLASASCSSRAFSVTSAVSRSSWARRQERGRVAPEATWARSGGTTADGPAGRWVTPPRLRRGRPRAAPAARGALRSEREHRQFDRTARHPGDDHRRPRGGPRSEEHTSELQSRENLVCRLLL